MGEQRVVGSEQDTIGANDIAYAPENPRIVDKRRSGSVVVDIPEKRAGTAGEFMERKATAPMRENKNIFREVGEELHEALKGCRHLNTAAHRGDGIGHVEVGRDLIFPRKRHERGEILVLEGESLNLRKKFTDSSKTAVQCTPRFFEPVSVP